MFVCRIGSAYDAVRLPVDGQGRRDDRGGAPGQNGVRHPATGRQTGRHPGGLDAVAQVDQGQE